MPAPKDPTKYEIWCKERSIRYSGQGNPRFGVTVNDETRKKIGLGNKGKKHTIEHNLKISESNKKRKHTLETKQKISEHHKIKNPMKGKTGILSPRWKGGISFEPYCEKFNKEFKERVRKFFGFKCVECGEPQNGTKLDVHHINYNKKACCDGSKPLFVALCHSCHSKTQRNRELWENYFTELINGYYQGNCYIKKGDLL